MTRATDLPQPPGRRLVLLDGAEHLCLTEWDDSSRGGVRVEVWRRSSTFVVRWFRRDGRMGGLHAGLSREQARRLAAIHLGHEVGHAPDVVVLDAYQAAGEGG